MNKITREDYLELLNTVSLSVCTMPPLINTETSLKNAIEKGYIELTWKEEALRIIDLRINKIENNQSIAHKIKEISIIEWVKVKEAVRNIEEKITIPVGKSEGLKCDNCHTLIEFSSIGTQYTFTHSNIKGNFCSSKCITRFAKRNKLDE